MRRTSRRLVFVGVLAGALAIASPAWATKTVCASGCAYTSINSAITALPPGSVITIAAGEYKENVVVNKEVTLKGSGATTIVYPGVSKPECGPGSLCGGEASNIVLVEANNVAISSMTLNGNNPTISSGVERGGQDIDARNGIIQNFNAGTFNGFSVSHVKVENVFLRGIYASAEGTFDLTHDTVENVQGNESSIAMFDFGGSGVMSANKVTSANDAISANWSTGTQFTKNIIKKSGSGVHTDNNGGKGGSADLISGNRVSECPTNGYGVFVFAPYVSATVTSNSIKGCAVGLAAFGSQVSGEGPKFVSNTVSGIGAISTEPEGTVGAYITTDLLGFGFADVTATLTGNTLTRFGTGLLVTQTKPSEEDEAGGQATVNADSDNQFTADQTGANGEEKTVVSAKEDWWGCAAGPNQAGACTSAIGTVEYVPWLTSRP